MCLITANGYTINFLLLQRSTASVILTAIMSLQAIHLIARILESSCYRYLNRSLLQSGKSITEIVLYISEMFFSTKSEI